MRFLDILLMAMFGLTLAGAGLLIAGFAAWLVWLVADPSIASYFRTMAIGGLLLILAGMLGLICKIIDSAVTR